LRWAAYCPERQLLDEMNKFLNLMLEGALARDNSKPEKAVQAAQKS
jgi:hypothetical protein